MLANFHYGIYHQEGMTASLLQAMLARKNRDTNASGKGKIKQSDVDGGLDGVDD